MPSGREHQPELPAHVSWAVQPGGRRRERAQCGCQGTNPGSVADGDRARENLMEVTRGRADHDLVHAMTGGAERHARRCSYGGGLPSGVASAGRGQVPGAAGRGAAARRQPRQRADCDHREYRRCGLSQRPAPSFSRLQRSATSHDRLLRSRSRGADACRSPRPACCKQAAVHQWRHMPLGEARAACPAGTDLASRSGRKYWTGRSPSRFPSHRTFHTSQAAFA
jgi:hypothetical protein